MAATTEKRDAEAVESNPEFVTPREFAEMFKLGRSTVQDMMDSKTIDTIPIPTSPGARKKVRRIPWSEVERIRNGL